MLLSAIISFEPEKCRMSLLHFEAEDGLLILKTVVFEQSWRGKTIMLMILAVSYEIISALMPKMFLAFQLFF